MIGDPDDEMLPTLDKGYQHYKLVRFDEIRIIFRKRQLYQK